MTCSHCTSYISGAQFHSISSHLSQILQNFFNKICPQEYHIEVKIQSAKNLRDAAAWLHVSRFLCFPGVKKPKDWMYGTSDPYCVCKPGGEDPVGWARDWDFG